MTVPASAPSSLLELPSRQGALRFNGRAVLAICLGTVVTLCVYGYQFGRGNHAVYLLDAMRRVDPSLLQHDWFATKTFQYHILFSELTAMLMRLRILEPGFAVAYLLLILLFHVAWRGIVRSVGGDDAAYLLSVALYYLSAAGTGLGMYQFFQDSSVLPSNIANVVLLAGIWLWLIKRYEWSGACFGLAAIFHLNFAIVGSLIWLVLCIGKPLRTRRLLIGSAAALLPAGVNVLFAAHLTLTRSGAMPLHEFIDLYVRLRHPHHYDPSTWPIGIWLAFAWTVAPAVIVLRADLRRIVILLIGLIAVALIGAGVWFVNETLVQMSLYRFGIYVQLLGCIAAAVWIRRLHRKREIAMLSACACAGIAVVCAVRGPFFGVFRMPRDDPGYVALCRWVSQNTPVDAVFLVPPDEESMRLIGRRAIVVNYKGVPQLSSELKQWRDRMCGVLAMDDLTKLPHGYIYTLPAIGRRYEQLSCEQLIAIARKYTARYIVTTHPLAGQEVHLVPTGATGKYMLYDLGAEQRDTGKGGSR